MDSARIWEDPWIMLRLSLILFLTMTVPGSAHAPEDAFCIANGTDATHVFVTETREGVRKVEQASPGAMLCSDTTSADDGIVSVFESFDALEGCARIIGRGTVESLIAYAEFDRCAWSSHGS